MSIRRTLRNLVPNLLLTIPLLLGGCKYVYESFTVTDEEGRKTAYYCIQMIDPEVPNIASSMFETLRDRAASELNTKAKNLAYAEGRFTKKTLSQLSGDGEWFCYQFFAAPSPQ